MEEKRTGFFLVFGKLPLSIQQFVNQLWNMLETNCFHNAKGSVNALGKCLKQSIFRKPTTKNRFNICLLSNILLALPIILMPYWSYLYIYFNIHAEFLIAGFDIFTLI